MTAAVGLVRHRLLLVLAACALLLPSCGRGPAQDEVLVFASASLAEAFEDIVHAFEAERPGTRVALHCAGTPRLLLQLREGAPADVLATADEPSMASAAALEPIGPPFTFATNTLVVLTAAENPRGITALDDLAREDVRVLLCAPDVPAGRYAREAFAKAGLSIASVSDEPSVKAVVAKVLLGEADAGIVYATDAVSAGTRLRSFPFPPELDVVARYPIARLRTDKDGTSPNAEAFLAFVQSKAGRALLERRGFGTP